MRRFNLAIFILSDLLLGLSCGQNKSNDANIVLSYDTTLIAILNYDTSNFWIAKTPTALKLTQPDLYAVDSLLIQCIAGYNKLLTDNISHLPDEFRQRKFNQIEFKEYKRQYIPYVDNLGQRIVWVNCFCTDNIHWKNWNKNAVPVADNGKCFFTLKINLSTKAYFDFYVNGYG